MRALLWIIVAGCAASDASVHRAPAPAAPSAPVAPITGTVGLVPGEVMTYEVKLGGIVAGEAAIAVGEVGDYQGHRTVVVKSRAATAGAVNLVKHVVDEATTWVDLDTGRPLRLETFVELDGKTNRATATFADRRADITAQHADDPPKTTHIAFAAEVVFDTHSAMAQVRGWRATKGTTRSVFVVGGKRLWRVEMTYVGDEALGTELGNRRAIRLDGAGFRARANGRTENDKATRTFSVWLSDDADRVPLRVVGHTELGEITMELTDYSRPR